MHKTAAAVFLFALFVFAGAFEAAAQKNSPTKSDVDRLVEKARETLTKSSYRETMVTSTIDPVNNVNQTFGFTNSYIPTDKWHCEHYAKSGGNLSGRGEVIILGKDIFARSGSQPWKRDASGGCESGTDSLAEWEYEILGLEKVIPVVLHKEVELDGTPAQMFTVTFSRYFEKYDNENTYVSTYWFDNYGKILKAVRESKSTKRKALQQRTSVYSYLSDLVIEAPIK